MHECESGARRKGAGTLTVTPTTDKSPDSPPVRFGRAWIGRLTKPISWPLLVVVIAALGFIGPIFWVSWLKYYTFNATYLDLGLGNHIYWLLTHGGIAEYQRSGLASIYPVQYEESMYFLIAPFYALAPGIPFLLALQSAALGLAAIPLYLLARRHLHARWIPVLIAGIYLSFFSISSAALFDFHNESLFPLLFFSAVLAYDTQHKRLFYLLGFLAAIIDPLTLLLVLFFTLTTQIPRGAGPAFAKLVSAVSVVRRNPRDVLFAGGLAVLLIVYYVIGDLFSSFLGIVGPPMGPLSILLFAINDKVAVLLLLFGALAFIPLLEWRTSFILIPYFGFVFYSTDPSHWQLFGLQYLQLATGPLFYGLILAIEHLVPAESSTPEVNGSDGHSSSESSRYHIEARRWRGRDRQIWGSKAVKALVVVALVLGIVYFPLSPVNESVSGGYSLGYANLRGITTVTPAVAFLWKVIALIPANASVLTQNNIPQLSGREFVETPGAFSASIPYNYILIDSTLTYFSPMIGWAPYINNALVNEGFGIVANGWGALLLERGYTGPIRLFVPTVNTYSGNQFLPGAAVVNGTTLVGNVSAFGMWYGPYAQLFPGSYTVNFTLSSNRTQPATIPAITLDVYSAYGALVYAQRVVYLGNFSGPNQRTVFEVNFVLPDYISGVEFPGLTPTGAATLTLWNVTLTSTR